MNSQIRHVVFDLDGTLVDSFKTIYYSTVSALKKLNIPGMLSEEEFKKRIGLHFIDIFDDLSIPVKNFDEFLNIYKDIYFDFINLSSLYIGVTDTLKFLNDKNILVSLLTTKKQDQADKNIDHFELRKYFSFVMGRRDGIENKPSAEPLLFICRQLNLAPEETMMIGDTELDLRCGANAGTKTCAALYGYRPKEFLINEKPDFLISNISELNSIIDKISVPAS